jgi:hypothetical protein
VPRPPMLFAPCSMLHASACMLHARQRMSLLGRHAPNSSGADRAVGQCRCAGWCAAASPSSKASKHRKTVPQSEGRERWWTAEEDIPLSCNRSRQKTSRKDSAASSRLLCALAPPIALPKASRRACPRAACAAIRRPLRDPFAPLLPSRVATMPRPLLAVLAVHCTVQCAYDTCRVYGALSVVRKISIVYPANCALSTTFAASARPFCLPTWA